MNIWRVVLEFVCLSALYSCYVDAGSDPEPMLN